MQYCRDFGGSIGLLFMNLYPSITAPKGHRARLAYAKAFRSYYARGLVKNASGIVKGRYSDLTAGGMTHDDLGSFEIGVVVAAAMNSVEAMFWMLCYLFSDPALLDEVREEINGIANREGEEICLDVSQLQRDCPLLVSVWQETLRMANVAVSSRMVVEDVMLNDTYLLRKNSVVQIPARVMHNSPAIWGPDAHIFNGKRFLKSNTSNLSREEKKLQKQGFTPFGGGVVLCPGRHFATTEILGVAATIVMGFDMRMKDGGTLRVPGARKQGMSIAVKQPEGEVEILMRRREGYEGVRWTYEVGGETGAADVVF
jgi:cytochrome P450